MPKVLIMSDSHGLTKELITIKERHKLKHMIHCGDSELPANTTELKHLHTVGGNCDMDPEFPEEQVMVIEGKRFFVVHGHLHRVKTGLLPLSYRAKEVGADVVCYGHTHMASVDEMDGQLFINPGSIRMPRGIREKTYAILEWIDTKCSIRFYTPEGKEVSSLSYHKNL
jgi:hypothetical protein